MVEGYTVKFLFQSISWNTLLEVFHEPWNTFMKYFYFSISVSLRMFLVDIKNCVYREKISSDSENLLTLILINNICCSKQRKKKKTNKRLQHYMFSCGFCEMFQNIYLAEYLQTAASGVHVWSACCIYGLFNLVIYRLIHFCIKKLWYKQKTVICCKESKQLKNPRFSVTNILKDLKKIQACITIKINQ